MLYNSEKPQEVAPISNANGSPTNGNTRFRQYNPGNNQEVNQSRQSNRPRSNAKKLSNTAVNPNFSGLNRNTIDPQKLITSTAVKMMVTNGNTQALN
jgi:hypothetical protein